MKASIERRRASARPIAIKVPAIITQELFDQVQERLRVAASRYRKVSIQALLSGFIRCADCGRLFAHGYTNERYRLRTGGTGTRERGQYRCSKRVDDHRHHVSNRGRCRNTGIEACADFDDKRAFLRDYVERIVFDRGRITILGSLPLDGATPRTLPFRIEGEIAKGSKRRWAQDERFGSWIPGAALTTCI
jgi:hypothetical protein